MKRLNYMRYVLPFSNIQTKSNTNQETNINMTAQCKKLPSILPITHSALSY